MNKTEYFAPYGVRERAGHYTKTRRTVREIHGEDAVPLGRSARVKQIQEQNDLARKIREAEILYGMRSPDPPTRNRAGTAEEAVPLRSRSTRVPPRENIARSSASVRNGAGTRPADGVRRDTARTRPQPGVPPKTSPRNRSRSDPDPRMNTDEIFISQKERDARKLEAYRLAKRRKFRHQARRALSAMLMTCLFVGCALSVVYKLVYVIRDVDVTGSTRYTSEEILMASGVQPGDNLYSFSSRIAENAITLRYPYVRELDVNRKAPSTVHFAITEDTAVFYAEIYGETRALSSSLRVLDRVNAEEIEALGLIRLRMPEIESAMAGRVVRFREEKYTRQIREITAKILASPLTDRITAVDLRNPYKVSAVADKRFLLDFGNNADLDIKMKVAAAVLADDLFKTDVKAQIDLSVSNSTSVILDNQLDLDA